MTLFFKQACTNVHVSMHAVLGLNMRDEARASQETIYLVAGCFRGIEKALRNVPGIVTTAIGYMGGHSTNPTHEQACSHSTGHAETVHVVFDTAPTSIADLVRPFLETHDPTQVGGQGNDIDDQYRSVIWTTTPKQLRDTTVLRTVYQEVLTKCGSGPIQIVISPAPDVGFTARLWYAEDYHQQYLFKNPGGYECHAHTGVACPALPHGQLTRETDMEWAGTCVPACPTLYKISSYPGCR